MNTAKKSVYWVIALLWLGFVGFASWMLIEVVQQSGGVMLHLITVLIGSLLLVFETNYVVLGIVRWIEGDTKPDKLTR